MLSICKGANVFLSLVKNETKFLDPIRPVPRGHQRNIGVFCGLEECALQASDGDLKLLELKISYLCAMTQNIKRNI